MPRFLIERLVSGGQTGADRAGLDAAIALGIHHGGWCPRGRRAEDGRIPDRYLLTETPSANYLQRTEWNVRDSDGTVVFTLGQARGRGVAQDPAVRGAAHEAVPAHRPGRRR